MIERTINNRIITASGIEFWPLNPRPEDVRIEDIAHGLSKVCRYNGHVKSFYSVAQHSVYVSHIVPRELALCGLLHDASEAYIADICAPIKPHIQGYAQIEDRLMSVIAQVFKFPYPMPPEIKDADRRMYATERRDVCPTGHTCPLASTHPEIAETIEPWEPETARVAFLQRYRELTAVPQFKMGAD